LGKDSTPDLDAIPYALKAMDQPTIDGLNTFLIARQTRAAGIKVALSGLGGDELSQATPPFATFSAWNALTDSGDTFHRFCGGR
jgi:asparagine synthetase B (glutamine-hydrolysing)